MLLLIEETQLHPEEDLTLGGPEPVPTPFSCVAGSTGRENITKRSLVSLASIRREEGEFRGPIS